MPDRIMQWIAVLGFVGVLIVFVTEVRRWRLIGPMLSRRQRILRVCLILLIEALFVMMFLGPMFTAHGGPVAALIYWTICVILTLAVVVLAIFDVREVLKGYVQLNHRMFGDLWRDDKQDK